MSGPDKAYCADHVFHSNLCASYLELSKACARCAVHGTDIVYADILLRACYATPGTDVAYGASPGQVEGS
eukprot:3941283-Rhodomonas_salina.2